MIVITRIDLDECDPLMLSKLIRLGLITVGQAMDSKQIRGMSELHQLLWKRNVESIRDRIEGAA